MHGGRLPGQVQAPGMQPTRVGHPARASGAARVQEQPPPAHQDKLLQQRRRQQHLLGAQHGHGRPAGALRGHGWPAGTHDGHTRAGDGRRAAVQNGRGVLADRPRGRWSGLLGRRRDGRQGRLLLRAGRARGDLQWYTSRAACVRRVLWALRAAGSARAAGHAWAGPCPGCLCLAAAGRTNSLPMALGRVLWHWGGC